MQVTYSIHTVRVELYESVGDYVRLVLEVILTIWVCIQMLSEFWAIIQAKRQQVLPLPPPPPPPPLPLPLPLPPLYDVCWQPCAASVHGRCNVLASQSVSLETATVATMHIVLVTLHLSHVSTHQHEESVYTTAFSDCNVNTEEAGQFG